MVAEMVYVSSSRNRVTCCRSSRGRWMSGGTAGGSGAAGRPFDQPASRPAKCAANGRADISWHLAG